ncbi:hypothetical protein FKV75_00380 [Weissella paramesenteroides]|uniref:hypothetical protein n=1 Tax=Weissella paramesenteroides TaxID=1249 RepID=UPI0012391BDF|nr:hypothetical protein [Weissella paramesenteroides]KAA8442636.1 hypothetical protein FKV77_05295 [Weissella paramesenteroides]KAA8442982.1 hypothetical protein FKV81_01285 [Weissella paramesenteroides]KAA8444342.1 hypothetical protein FKV75_00380 [Weissella paramesenteroides]KAA8448010.1 hypothetical protein FKV76_01945 [Weissella paramesenteroides]KAA8452177.1 hypothetical protein FKV74_01285 [Weissella paramesenteroides]
MHWADIAAIVGIIGGVSTAVGFIFKTAIKGSLYPISSRMDSLIDSLDRLNKTFDKQEIRINAIDERLDKHDRKLERHDEKLINLSKEVFKHND